MLPETVFAWCCFLLQLCQDCCWKHGGWRSADTLVNRRRGEGEEQSITSSIVLYNVWYSTEWGKSFRKKHNVHQVMTRSTVAHLDSCFHGSRAGSEDPPVFLLQLSLLPLAPAAPHWGHGHAWESSWGLRRDCKPLPPHVGGEARGKRMRSLTGCPLGPHPRRNRRRWRGRGNPSRRVVRKTGRLTGWLGGSDHL